MVITWFIAINETFAEKEWANLKELPYAHGDKALGAWSSDF